MTHGPGHPLDRMAGGPRGAMDVSTQRPVTSTQRRLLPGNLQTLQRCACTPGHDSSATSSHASPHVRARTLAGACAGRSDAPVTCVSRFGCADPPTEVGRLGGRCADSLEPDFRFVKPVEEERSVSGRSPSVSVRWCSGAGLSVPGSCGACRPVRRGTASVPGVRDLHTTGTGTVPRAHPGARGAGHDGRCRLGRARRRGRRWRARLHTAPVALPHTGVCRAAVTAGRGGRACRGA